MLFGWDIFLHVLFLHPLGRLSLGASLVVWTVRILTVSLLFRTYIGPATVRLVSKRLRIRSVSLRSIRGVYFKAGSGTWKIDRVGISYHRPSLGKASRFSFKVERLSLELDGQSSHAPRKTSTTDKGRVPSKTNPSRFLGRASWMVLSTVYTTVEPYCRPAVRSFFVALLRVGISALPALTHVVDFELDSAVITFTALPGVSLSVGDAKLHTRVSLAYLPSAVAVEGSKERSPAGHRRFSSVADWNARVQGSVRRTWDRAWGATQVMASVILQVKNVNGHVDKDSDLYAGRSPTPGYMPNRRDLASQVAIEGITSWICLPSSCLCQRGSTHIKVLNHGVWTLRWTSALSACSWISFKSFSRR